MIRPRNSLFVVIIVLGLFITACVRAQAQGHILLLEAEGPLTPAMAEYLDRGIAKAESENAEAIIFVLDTPGGEIQLMNRMVKTIRMSQVPVIVYVSPRGAIAGSAGMILVLAGHASAMAPETAIGAASPVSMEGEDLGETIETKQKELLKAEVRSMASWRGEEAVALAEAAIDEAKAASVEEAYEANLIDFIADDVDSLVQDLDGFTVETVYRDVQLHTEGAEVVVVRQSLIEQLLQALTNPNVVFILLTIGVQAILIELSSPGGWVAGFIGVVCLALGVYGLGVIPVNWFGLIFMGIAFVLFLLEIKAPTHGALAAAGLGSFIAGALILFNTTQSPSFQRVSVPLVVIVGIFVAATFMFIVGMALRAQRRQVTTGAEALIGSIAQTRTKLDPDGKVFVVGELWSAVLEEGFSSVEEGTEVEVVYVDGFLLHVRPVGDTTS
ncbi:MAG: nodulation protein NfeD [Anaerolineales bacterium]|nr:nodulation protein NfeD [Anaerolineales bacterium]